MTIAPQTQLYHPQLHTISGTDPLPGLVSMENWIKRSEDQPFSPFYEHIRSEERIQGLREKLSAEQDYSGVSADLGP